MIISQKTQNIIGMILCVILIVGFNIFMVCLLWRGIRSLMGKTINLPPSKKRWMRTRAEVIEDEETGERLIRYYYDYQEYTAKIKGFSVYGDKAMIYVDRSDPTVVKEFIPQPPMTASAAVSCIFIAVMILIFELIFILV